MATDKNSFVIYKAFYDPIKDMSNADLGELFRAVFEYQINGSEPGPQSPIKIPFAFFKNQFNIDDEKYERIVERNRNNGANGGRPKKANKPSGKNGNPAKPQKADNDNVNVNGNGKDNDNVNVNGIVYPWEGPRFLEAWGAWKLYREKEHRFKYKTAITEQTALKQLATVANGSEDMALRIMEQSVAFGWKGFFKIKDAPSQGNGSTDQEYLNELKNRLS